MRYFEYVTLEIGDIAYSWDFRAIRQVDKKTKIYPWHFGFKNYYIERCAEKIFPEIEGHFGIKFSQKTIIIKISYKAIADAEATMKRVLLYENCRKVHIKKGEEIKNLLQRFCRQYRYKLINNNCTKSGNFLKKYFGKFLLDHGFELISCSFEIKKTD